MDQNKKTTKTEVDGKTSKKTFCKGCGKITKNGNEFCNPEEGRDYAEDHIERDDKEDEKFLQEEEDKITERGRDNYGK